MFHIYNICPLYVHLGLIYVFIYIYIYIYRWHLFLCMFGRVLIMTFSLYLLYIFLIYSPIYSLSIPYVKCSWQSYCSWGVRDLLHWICCPWMCGGWGINKTFGKFCNQKGRTHNVTSNTRGKGKQKGQRIGNKKEFDFIFISFLFPFCILFVSFLFPYCFSFVSHLFLFCFSVGFHYFPFFIIVFLSLFMTNVSGRCLHHPWILLRGDYIHICLYNLVARWQ